MSAKFKIIVFLSFVLIVFFSCKKETKQPIESIVTAPVQQTDTANYIYGWLRKYAEYHSNAGQKKHYWQYAFGCAYLSWTPVYIKNTNDSIDYIVGLSVLIDNSMYLTDQNGRYISNRIYNASANTSWRISNSSVSGAPSFTASSALAFPNSEDYKNVPPFISKENGITLTFSHYMNTERIKVYLLDNIYNNTISKEVVVTGNLLTITFTKNEIASLVKTSTGYIDIYFYNDEIQRIQNKNYRFSSVTRDLISNVAITN